MQASPQRSPPLLTDSFLITIGVVCAAFGLEGFLLPNNFIDGGVTGVCLLLAKIFDWPLSLLLIVINLPFLWLAKRVIGPRFTIKTAGAIVLLAILVYVIDFPILTDDKLLVAIFGGVLLGGGIGMSMRGGSVLDGTEVLAIFLSRNVGAKVSDWVIIINLFIFGLAATTLSLEQAMYSMLTYIVASKTIDFIIDGVEEYTGVTIISPLSADIRQQLITTVGCGVTIYTGRGGYGAEGDRHREYEILYAVITRLEIRKLTLAVQEIDRNAFLVFSSISDVHGGMVKKRRI